MTREKENTPFAFLQPAVGEARTPHTVLLLAINFSTARKLRSLRPSSDEDSEQRTFGYTLK